MLAVYGVLAVGMTLPAWTADAPMILGEASGLDLTGSVWAHWWAADALQRGASPFVGDYSFFPSGVSPLLQYNLLDAIIHAPLVAMMGLRIGYNLACVLVLVSTGWAAHRLGQAAGASHSAAVLTGVLVQASSFVALELHCGRISQAMLVFLLLALSNAVRMLRGEHATGFAVATGVLAAAAALVYWYYGAALLLAGVVILALGRASLDRGSLRAIGIAAVTGLSLTLPLVYALWDSWAQLPGIERADAASIIEANSRGLLWPVLNADPVFGHQLSLVALLLAGVALWRGSRDGRTWGAMAVLGWVLALGPGGEGGLPFDWLQTLIPGMDRMWWPYRFEVLAVVGVAVLAGLGLDRLLTHRSRQGGWVVLAVLACTLDAPVRSGLLPITASTLPEYTEGLYPESSGALLTVPLNPSPSEAERLMLFQIQHGQPIPVGDGAHIPSHVPHAQDEWSSTNALLSALRDLQARGAVRATIQSEDVAALMRDGFTHAVVDPAVFDAARALPMGAAYSEVFRALWGEPVRTTRGGGTWEVQPLAETVVLDVVLRRGSERVRGGAR